jgi:beta-galactosidase
MDYLGEAGIASVDYFKADNKMPFPMAGWPWVVSWCGDIDLIGDQKAPSRYRDVVWGLSKLEMAVQRPVPEGRREVFSNWGWSDELVSWSWPGSEGKPMAVRLYTPGDRVEVLLNGAKAGEVSLTVKNKLRAEIRVPYAPGTIEAVAYQGSAQIARRRIETVGPATQLRLRPETPSIGRGRQGLAYVNIDVLDGRGRLLPDDRRTISLVIDGPAELAGFGSASPLAVGSYQANHAQTFHGRALAILRGVERAGTVRVTASAEGLPAASTTIRLA